MDQGLAVAGEPPSSNGHDGGDSFAARAFGYGTTRYRAFLDALLDGLRLYEASSGVGRARAQEPVPAA
jgi:hypothetical protein